MEGGSAFRWNVIRLVLKTFIKRKMNILSFYCYEARVLNGSLQPAISQDISRELATYFSLEITLKKSQNLIMSVFRSNTLICVPECWKCTLRGPDFKIFPRLKGHFLDPLVTFGIHKLHLLRKFFLSLPTPQLLPPT